MGIMERQTLGTYGMNTLLSTVDLSVGYGASPLVMQVGLQLHAGELVALIGVNGGGKSTMLNTLAGLHAPLAGTISVQGELLATLSAAERARHLAIVFTGRPQAGLLDVRSVVALGRQPWTGHFGRLTNNDLRLVDDAMDLLDVSAFAERSLQRLSDGEAQRVMIARALAQDTPILLLDEPMAFLDLVNRSRLLGTLRKLARDHQKAVLFSTHDIHSARHSCDRIFLIHDQRLWCGTPSELRSSGILKKVFVAEGLDFDLFEK